MTVNGTDINKQKSRKVDMAVWWVYSACLQCGGLRFEAGLCQLDHLSLPSTYLH